MSTARPAPTSIRLGDDLAPWLDGRSARAATVTGTGARARAEAGTVENILAAELRRFTWVLGEIGLVADVLNRPIPPDLIPAAAFEVLRHGFHTPSA